MKPPSIPSESPRKFPLRPISQAIASNRARGSRHREPRIYTGAEAAHTERRGRIDHPLARAWRRAGHFGRQPSPQACAPSRMTIMRCHPLRECFLFRLFSPTKDRESRKYRAEFAERLFPVRMCKERVGVSKADHDYARGEARGQPRSRFALQRHAFVRYAGENRSIAFFLAQFFPSIATNDLPWHFSTNLACFPAFKANTHSPTCEIRASFSFHSHPRHPGVGQLAHTMRLQYLRFGFLAPQALFPHMLYKQIREERRICHSEYFSSTGNPLTLIEIIHREARYSFFDKLSDP